MSIVTNPSRISKEHVAVPEETKGKQERWGYMLESVRVIS